MTVRVHNCAKHLAFTLHISIKEPDHISLSDKKAQVLLPLGQKALQTIQALTCMRNSPALSPFTTKKTKPASLPCSTQLFFNLESLLCSPQKNSLCEWWIFSYSGGMCYQLVLISKPNRHWRIHPVSVEWWQKLAPRAEYWDAVPYHLGSFLSSLAFKLTLLYAGEHALWATAVWLACAFTLLLGDAFVSAC